MEQEMLEKIDIIRGRLGVSYREATEALEQTSGELVEALILLEEKRLPITEKIYHLKEGAWDQLKGFVQKGQNTKIRVKKDDQTLVEFPATWGAIGLAGTFMRTEFAVIGLAATATALMKDWNIDVVSDEQEAYLAPMDSEDF